MMLSITPEIWVSYEKVRKRSKELQQRSVDLMQECGMGKLTKEVCDKEMQNLEKEFANLQRKFNELTE